MNFKYYHTSRLICFLIVLYILTSQISINITLITPIKEIWELVGPLSPLFLVGLVMLIINNFLWKSRIFSWLIDLPNLNGRYEGELVSSYMEDGKNIYKKCIVEIKQTASQIHIYAYFGDKQTDQNLSSSTSVSEQIIKENNGLFKIYYIFSNESDVLQEKLNNHVGTGMFKYYPDLKQLEGNYYNQRLNTGSIKVKFAQKKLLGRLVK